MKIHLFTLAVLLTLHTVFTQDHWYYPDMDVDEVFPKWGGVCDSGTRQSPINLSARGALKGIYDNLDFNNYEDKQKDVSMVNNGHSIQLSGFTDVMTLKGGPLKDIYVVEQVHLHWWSEHTIDNVRYPLEAHIVHRNKRYPNVTVAAAHEDGITVIGVLYHLSNYKNDAIQKIVDNLDGVKSYSQINQPITMKDKFAVDDLFPDINGYMTYAGSLTTPSCAESVTWIVLHETFPVTMEQVNEFKEIEYEQGKYLKNNYRTIQKANNRPVIIVLADDDDDKSGSSSAASPKLISLGAVLIFSLVAKLIH